MRVILDDDDRERVILQ